MLICEPYIPLALWFPLVTGTLLALVVYAIRSKRRLPFRRRVAVLSLMTVAAALPLGLLLNPTWLERIPPPAGKPALTILVDSSHSMVTPDANSEGVTTRYAAAVQMARDVAQRLGDQFEIQLRSFDASGRVTDLSQLEQQSPAGMVTDLATAIEESLDDRPQGQALLLLSDGVHNAGGGAARVQRSAAQARAMGTPIYAQIIGQDSDVTDLEVDLNLPQEMAFAGQAVPITVSVTQRGALTDRARLSLLLNEQIVDEQDVAVAANQSAEATFRLQQADSGLYRYEVRVAALPQEVTDINNSATLILRVVDEPVRVLLLEGKPYWDTKFLIRTLSDDQSIELTSVVRTTANRFLRRDTSRPPEAGSAPPDKAVEVAPPETANETAAALRQDKWQIMSSPQEVLGDAAALAAYQIIVLGRDSEVYLDSTVLGHLKKWLAEGNGSLVCVRGPPSSPVNQRLGELLPLRWTPVRERRFRVRLTESGQSLRWLPSTGDDDLLSNLPSLASTAQPDRPKPLAVVLATASDTAENPAPVISYQPFGNGRVVVVEGAGMWRWAFLPTEHQDHDAVYGLLWRSLMRWLVSHAGLLPSQQYALRSEKVTFGTAETAAATFLVRAGETTTPPQVELLGDALEQPQLITPVPEGAAPGQFRVVFGKLPEGRYRARVAGTLKGDAGSEIAFDVRGSLAERLDIAARPDLLRLIAEESGGAMLAASEPGELSRRFQEHRSAMLPQHVRRVTAWDRWWVLVGVFGLWAVSWGVRRATGLV